MNWQQGQLQCQQQNNNDSDNYNNQNHDDNNSNVWHKRLLGRQQPKALLSALLSATCATCLSLRLVVSGLGSADLPLTTEDYQMAGFKKNTRVSSTSAPPGLDSWATITCPWDSGEPGQLSTLYHQGPFPVRLRRLLCLALLKCTTAVVLN